jgi:hypothetical protein
MRRIIACLAAVAVMAPLAVPAVASADMAASGVAGIINHQWRAEMQARLKEMKNVPKGLRLVGSRVRCTDIGNSTYSCIGTYTIEYRHAFVKYRMPIEAYPDGHWASAGVPQVVKVW